MSKKELHYSNAFNAFSLGSLKAKQIDFIFGIGYKMYTGKNLTAEIEEKEFKELVDYDKYSSVKKFHADVIAFLKAVNAISFVRETGLEIEVKSIFEDLTFNKETRVLKVIARPIFLEFFNNVMNQEYTIIDLKDLTNLKSSYSKLMYKLLKQWSTRSWVQFDLEEMYNLLGVPKSMKTTANFSNYILKPIKQELPKYFNDLQIEPIRTGRKISSYKFTWKKSKAKSKILDAEVVEPILITDENTFEYSIYESEQFKKWFYEKMGTVKLNNPIISILQTFKSENEAKKYLLDVKKSNLDPALMVSYILKKERPSEIIPTPKKKNEIAQEIINQDVINLLEKPKEEVVIYNKNLLGIQQYLYAKTMNLKTMTIGEKSRLINNLKSMEEAIKAGERLEIDMTYFKLEEPKIVIKASPEPEIKKVIDTPKVDLIKDKDVKSDLYKRNLLARINYILRNSDISSEDLEFYSDEEIFELAVEIKNSKI